MAGLVSALPWIMGGLILAIALCTLRRPLKWVFRLLARTGAGLGALLLLSKAGALIGVSLGVNLWNALVMGVLGAPGFALLLLLHWALR